MRHPWLALLIGVMGAGVSLHSPQASEALYESCASCHGPQAQGDPEMGAPRLAGQVESYLAEQMTHFSSGARGAHPDDLYGQTMALSMTGLSAQDIAALATYLSDMDAEPRSSADAPEGDPVAGQVFYEKHCASCHGQYAEGNLALFAPSLQVLDDWTIARQLASYRNGWRGGTDDTSTRAKSMRVAVEQITTSQEEADLRAFLANLKKP